MFKRTLHRTNKPGKDGYANDAGCLIIHPSKVGGPTLPRKVQHG